MATDQIRGRVAWIFSDENFDVDQIIGIKNIKINDPRELAGIAMKTYDPDFARMVRSGDLLVGGKNFGYGHPHYPPMKAMRHLGIVGVIAESFSPGFWRGEVSMGFHLIPCPGIVDIVERWQEISVDWNTGIVRNETTGQTLKMDPVSLADRRMMQTGGLIPYLKASLTEQQGGSTGETS